MSRTRIVGQAEKKAPRKEVIKLPWEPLTPFSEVLKSLPNRQNGTVDEEEDDDELEAYEDSLQRLRVSLEVVFVVR